MQSKLQRASAGVLSLALALAILSIGFTGGSALGENAAQQRKLPNAEKLLNDYVKITGGKNAYKAVKTRISKGTLSVAGIKGRMTVYEKDPNLMYMAADIKGIGKIEAGSNGKIVWELNPVTGPKVKSGDDKGDAFPALDMGADANWQDVYTKTTTLAQTTVQNKPAYKVELITKKGEKEFRYFDKATGLVLKMERAVNTELGNFTMNVEVSDYRKVGKLLIAHKASMDLLGQNVVIQLDSVQINPNIPDSRFDVPEAVQKLLKSRQN